MIIYIAGKISGDENYREKFAKQEKRLREKGHTVLNPAMYPEGLKRVDYMRMCFAMMKAADIVLFFSDYRESKGAQLELAWCEYVDKPHITDAEEAL